MPVMKPKINVLEVRSSSLLKLSRAASCSGESGAASRRATPSQPGSSAARQNANTMLPQMKQLRAKRISAEPALQTFTDFLFASRRATAKTNAAATARIRGIVSSSRTTSSRTQSSLKT